MKPPLLLIDDEPAIQFGFSEYLSRVGYSVHGALSVAEAREALAAHRFDAILLDLNLPDGNGLDLIAELRENYFDIPIIVITGIGDIPLAVESMRRGADNFLTKPVNMPDLDVFLQKSLELGALRRRQRTTQRLQQKKEPYFGQSPVMQKVMDLSSLALKNDSPIILQGETGTGKGILAKWIHEHSHRASSTFVEVNCASLKGELLASELFGHARGAFTSAVQDRQGLIEVADGGTLFLDEIGDMDLGVQAQFLKVIEEKQYRRLGEVRIRRSEFRLICATHRDLLEDTRQGKFRSDLYFRIHVFPIVIPPLRERSEDIPDLIRYMMEKLNVSRVGMSNEAMSLLCSYEWPGNVRELKNVIERA
ncbi:MAG: sigma-54 dependent transcriptional regulator, partial [Syntrophorhabdaceae bacterium]|nr:sigma-54 dependent transcriptional regulator [Syntrophorhabdaceae bacterium]